MEYIVSNGKFLKALPIILIFLVIFCAICIIQFSKTSNAFEIEENWGDVKKFNWTNSVVFTIYIDSNLDKEYLNENEFLLGDKINYCNIIFIDYFPGYMDTIPIKINFISPSGRPYSKYFFFMEKIEDKYPKYTTGWDPKTDDEIVALNESGVWEMEIIFDGNADYYWEYNGDYQTLKDSSKIKLFYHDFFVTYTNAEYQQLKSAKISAETSNMYRTSLVIAIITVIIALSGIILKYYFDTRNKKAMYARQNRIEIYQPLYEELIKKVKKLESWYFPFNKGTALDTWEKMDYSMKDRVPTNIIEKIDSYNKYVEEYREYYNHISSDILPKAIAVVLGKYRKKDEPGVVSKKTIESAEEYTKIKYKILEEYKRDFLVGIYPENHNRNYLTEILSYLDNKNLTEMDIFQEIVDLLSKDENVVHLRDLNKKLIEFSNDFIELLKDTIDTILKKYEGKTKDL